MKSAGLLLALGAGIAALAACSNEQVYVSVQQNKRFECRQLPEPQYRECIEQYDKTYEEYRRELEQARESR